MMKNLRLLFVAVLAMVGFNATAQDAVIDFSSTEDVWGMGTEKVEEAKSYTYNGITITLTPSTGNYFRWYNTGNILLGKQGATLQLSAFDFDVERIDIVGTSSASAAVKQNIFVGDEAVSTETTGAKDVTNEYKIAEAYQAAGNIYVLKVTSSHNTQITKINIYKKGSNAKEQPGLAWGTQSVTATIGENNYFPTLTNPHELAVSYTSSNEEVATIAADGTITLLKAGKTDISAVFEGNDAYEAQTAKYTLTVKEAIDPDAKGQVNNPYTIEECIPVLQALEGSAKSDVVYVKGYITNIDEVSTQYGNATFKIATEFNKDAEYKLTVYRAYYLEKARFTAEDQIKEGDLVVVCGQLQMYKNEGQLAQGGYIYSLNGKTAGINETKVAAEFNGRMYNMAGQVVNKSYKGLVIMNGKKFVQK